jgi:hypothetical protein
MTDAVRLLSSVCGLARAGVGRYCAGRTARATVVIRGERCGCCPASPCRRTPGLGLIRGTFRGCGEEVSRAERDARRVVRRSRPFALTSLSHALLRPPFHSFPRLPDFILGSSRQPALRRLRAHALCLCSVRSGPSASRQACAADALHTKQCTSALTPTIPLRGCCVNKFATFRPSRTVERVGASGVRPRASARVREPTESCAVGARDNAPILAHRLPHSFPL